MKLIIAGGRDFNDYELVKKSVLNYIISENCFEEQVTIISGNANGADKLGERLAKEFKYPLIIKKADWKTHNKSAGPIRNNQMADICSHAIIFWNGSSRGSKNMIDICIQRNIPHKVIRY